MAKRNLPPSRNRMTPVTLRLLTVYKSLKTADLELGKWTMSLEDEDPDVEEMKILNEFQDDENIMPEDLEVVTATSSTREWESCESEAESE